MSYRDDLESGKSDEEVKRGCCERVLHLFLRILILIRCAILGSSWTLREMLTRHRKMEKVQARNDVAIITGGTRGIGREITKKLLETGFTVIMGCRNPEQGFEVIRQIREEGVTTGSAECLHLDLESLVSVREFAAQVLAKGCPIHILINNAGLMSQYRKMTNDGFEKHFQVNYLSHFLLTNLLMSRIINSVSSSRLNNRIVNVTSVAHALGKIDFQDMTKMRNFYSPILAYGNSKLMQICSANYMDWKYLTEGVKNVKFYSVHPGVIDTSIYDAYSWARPLRCIFRLFLKNSSQGADGVMYAALSSDIEQDSGKYLANCKIYKPTSQALDRNVQAELWERSCELCGINK